MKSFIYFLIFLAATTVIICCSDSESVFIPNSHPPQQDSSQKPLIEPPDKDDDPLPIDIRSSTVDQNGAGIPNLKVKVWNDQESDSAITDSYGEALMSVTQADSFDYHIYQDSALLVHRIVQATSPETVLRDTLH